MTALADSADGPCVAAVLEGEQLGIGGVAGFVAEDDVVVAVGHRNAVSAADAPALTSTYLLRSGNRRR